MSDILSKWGNAVASRGFTQIPNYLLRINMFVHEDHQLSATETLILIHLISAWWKEDEMPFPSMRSLAEYSGISERQVQRAIKALDEKKYLVKTKKKVKTVISSNVYDLRPTVKILEEVAEHFDNVHPRKIKTLKGKKLYSLPKSDL